MRMRESAVALVLLIIVDALDGSNPNAADSRQGESREVEELVFPSTIGIVDRSALDRRWKRSAKALEQRCRCHDRDEYRELFELVHAVAPEHAVIALDREGTADHTGPEYHRLKCVIETAATEISTEVVHVQTLELYRQQRGEVGKIDLLVLPVDRHSSELIGSEAQKWLVAGGFQMSPLYGTCGEAPQSCLWGQTCKMAKTNPEVWQLGLSSRCGSQELCSTLRNPSMVGT